jgi:hypothetical protein
VLTRYDEMLCHQIVSTFDHPETSAREWTERIWVSAHDTSGDLHMVAGFGYYPNRNVIDAFGLVAIEGRTFHAVRASRELRPAIDEVSVGPFSYEIVEPLRKVRCSLDDNEYGLSYDLTFEGTMPPVEESPQFTRSRGRLTENIIRYLQVGRAGGLLRAGGKEYAVDREWFLAERDRSWGIRRETGIPEIGVQMPEFPVQFLFNLAVMQFDKWGCSYQLREDLGTGYRYFSGRVVYPYGDPAGGLDLTGLEHDFEFEPGSRRLKSGRLVLSAIDGSRREVTMRALSRVFLKCGGYIGGFRGFNHGLWLDSSFIDGFTLDMTDTDIVNEASLLDDVMCEFRCGDEVGYGIVELVIPMSYPKYGF